MELELKLQGPICQRCWVVATLNHQVHHRPNCGACPHINQHAYDTSTYRACLYVLKSFNSSSLMGGYESWYPIKPIGLTGCTLQYQSVQKVCPVSASVKKKFFQSEAPGAHFLVIAAPRPSELEIWISSRRNDSGGAFFVGALTYTSPCESETLERSRPTERVALQTF